MGADDIAHRWAKDRGKVVVVYYPDYTKYGKRAPLVRNITMLEDHLQGFVRGFPALDSRGTWHCIKNARERQHRVAIFDE